MHKKLALLFPATLAIGVITIPYVATFTDHQLVEQAVGSGYRWYVGHILTSASFGIGAVTVALLAQQLPPQSSSLTAIATTLLAAIGAGIQAAGLGADGIGPLATQNMLLPASTFFDGSSLLVPLTAGLGISLFGLAQILLVIQLNKQRQRPKGWAVVSMLSAISFTILPAIPSTISLYGTAVACWLIYWPIWRYD